MRRVKELDPGENTAEEKTFAGKKRHEPTLVHGGDWSRASQNCRGRSSGRLVSIRHARRGGSPVLRGGERAAAAGC